MEKVCQDCQCPLIVKTGSKTEAQNQESGTSGLMSIINDGDVLRSNDHYQDVISIQAKQVFNAVPEDQQIKNEPLYVFTKVNDRTECDLTVKDVLESDL